MKSDAQLHLKTVQYFTAGIIRALEAKRDLGTQLRILTLYVANKRLRFPHLLKGCDELDARKVYQALDKLSKASELLAQAIDETCKGNVGFDLITCIQRLREVGNISIESHDKV